MINLIKIKYQINYLRNYKIQMQISTNLKKYKSQLKKKSKNVI